MAKKMNRRDALSTAGKAAAGIVGLVIIGGGVYIMTQQGGSEASVTVTQTQNVEETVTETITTDVVSSQISVKKYRPRTGLVSLFFSSEA